MSGQAASHTSKRPDFHGVRVTPSGLLPSDLISPDGSSLEGMWADVKALFKISFRAAWRWCLPSLCLQLRACLPNSSTMAEQCWHWCGRHTGVPRRRATAIRTVLSSIRSPREDTGKALNHAPDSLSDTESRRACSTSLIASCRRR